MSTHVSSDRRGAFFFPFLSYNTWTAPKRGVIDPIRHSRGHVGRARHARSKQRPPRRTLRIRASADPLAEIFPNSWVHANVSARPCLPGTWKPISVLGVFVDRPPKQRLPQRVWVSPLQRFENISNQDAAVASTERSGRRWRTQASSSRVLLARALTALCQGLHKKGEGSGEDGRPSRAIPRTTRSASHSRRVLPTVSIRNQDRTSRTSRTSRPR